MEDILTVNKPKERSAFLQKHQTFLSVIFLITVLWNSACWQTWATGFYDYLAFKINDMLYYLIHAGIILVLGLICIIIFDKKTTKVLVCTACFVHVFFWTLHTISQFPYSNYSVLINEQYILPVVVTWMRTALLSNLFVGILFLLSMVYVILIRVTKTNRTGCK